VCVGGAVVDRTLACCSRDVDAYGLCCGAGDAVDANGACCPPSRMDACGVCDGNGRAVDIQGMCCDTPLPASGVCCASGVVVDDCGVCGGVGECPLSGEAVLYVPNAVADGVRNRSAPAFPSFVSTIAAALSNTTSVNASAVVNVTVVEIARTISVRGCSVCMASERD
jgi:hypothetical protein